MIPLVILVALSVLAWLGAKLRRGARAEVERDQAQADVQAHKADAARKVEARAETATIPEAARAASDHPERAAALERQRILDQKHKAADKVRRLGKAGRRW